MAYTIINLTRPVIANRVEHILSSHPTVSDQQTFASPLVRERLVTYVVRRMPTLYTTTDQVDATTAIDCSLVASAQCFSGEQISQMDSLIRQGMRYLATQAAQAIAESSTTPLGNCHLTPSTWFG